MIWVRLAGGLGNQLFQLAAAIELHNIIAAPVNIFHSHLQHYNTVRPYHLPQVLDQPLETGKPPFLMEVVTRYRFNKILPQIFPWYIHSGNFYNTDRTRNYVLDDYFQNVQQIKNGVKTVAQNIRNNIAANKKIQFAFEKLSEGYSKDELAAVHIRRGDYLTPANKKVFYNLDERYYEKAITALPKKIKKVIVFSESDNYDLININPIKIDSVKEMQLNDVDEFLLMCMFQHFIIANSTFSYWASMVGRTDQSVMLGPKDWTYRGKENDIWNANLETSGFNLL